MMPHGGSNSLPLANSEAAAAAGSSPSRQLSQQLEDVAHSRAASKPSFGELILEEESSAMEDKDRCIHSQDFVCTPDHPTPDAPRRVSGGFDAGKENVDVAPCPRTPDSSVAWSKGYKRAEGAAAPQTVSEEEEQVPRLPGATPPPCIKNPYITDPRVDDEVFLRPSHFKPSGYSPSFGANPLSRYHTDFLEIEQIGCGHFGVVFKVLRRIEGCLYAVKQIIKQLHNDNDMSLALREVQTLVALGNHENIVGYFTSWFESKKLYIQMELCDRCLSLNKNEPLKFVEALELVYQVCKALDFIHQRGVAHLDVKLDNIYVRNGVYKLADFGCAALIDRSLAIEEGDTRYMPLELMNGKIEHLDKVDIFSLGAGIHELMRGSLLPKNGPEFTTLREDEIPLIPGWPMQLQSLIKFMMDPNPVRRPSAKEILRHPIFEKLQKAPKKM